LGSGGLFGSPVVFWVPGGPLGGLERAFGGLGALEGRLVLWEPGGPLGTGCGPLGVRGVLWEPGGLLGAWGTYEDRGLPSGLG
jgi:hypothetical protein